MMQADVKLSDVSNLTTINYVVFIFIFKFLMQADVVPSNMSKSATTMYVVFY